jgi:hypothetical protein
MDDDFEVFGMDDNFRVCGFKPRTEIGQAVSAGTIEEEIVPQSAPEKDMNLDVPVQSEEYCRHMGMKIVQDGLANKIHFGESIQSIRQVLKRAMLHEIFSLQADSGGLDQRALTWFRSIYPYYGGYTDDLVTPTSIVTSTRFGNYLFANMTHLNYFGCGFNGWRGGVRYHIDAGYSVANTQSTWMASFINPRTGYPGGFEMNSFTDWNLNAAPYFRWSITPVLTAGDIVANRANSLKNHPTSANGSVRWNTEPNKICSFECPFHSEYRFGLTKVDRIDLARQYAPCFRVDTTTLKSSSQPNYTFKHVSAAEDFQLLFYTGPPVFYNNFIPDVEL